jgi:hypothetical protein
LVHFWRTKAKAEVDFVVELPDHLIPIKVKCESFNREKITTGLLSFIRAYSPAIAIVVTMTFLGEKQIDNTKVRFIPIVYF